MVMVVRFEKSSKAQSSITPLPFEIVMFSMFDKFLSISLLLVVKPAGNTKLFKLVQPSNAVDEIYVTVEGIVTLVKPSQYAKA